MVRGSRALLCPRGHHLLPHPAEGSSSLQSPLLWPSQSQDCSRSFPNAQIQTKPGNSMENPQPRSSSRSGMLAERDVGCFRAQRETMQPRRSQLPLFAPEEVGSYGNLCFNKREIKSILPFPCWRHPHFPLFITSHPLPRQPRQPRQGWWWQVGPVPAPHPARGSSCHTGVSRGTHLWEGGGWKQTQDGRKQPQVRMLLATNPRWGKTAPEEDAPGRSWCWPQAAPTGVTLEVFACGICRCGHPSSQPGSASRTDTNRTPSSDRESGSTRGPCSQCRSLSALTRALTPRRAILCLSLPCHPARSPLLPVVWSPFPVDLFPLALHRFGFTAPCPTAPRTACGPH